MVLIETTTVTITRPLTGDPYEIGSAVTEVATGLSAHISSPSGSEARIGGEREQVTAVLLIDPGVDLARTDRVVDDITGETYDVAWVRTRTGLGLDHVKAGLVAFKGAAVGG